MARQLHGHRGLNSTVHPEIACYCPMSGGPIFEEHTMADFVEYMFEAEALKAGAEFVYEMPAVQLVQDESEAIGAHSPEQVRRVRAVQRFQGRRFGQATSATTTSTSDKNGSRRQIVCSPPVLDQGQRGRWPQHGGVGRGRLPGRPLADHDASPGRAVGSTGPSCS